MSEWWAEMPDMKSACARGCIAYRSYTGPLFRGLGSRSGEDINTDTLVTKSEKL